MKLQVYFPHHFNAGIKFLFSLQCPGEFINNVLKLQLFHNGLVHGNVQYFDLCKVVSRVNIAYNNWGKFRIDKVSNTLLEYKPAPMKERDSAISQSIEIIGSFLRLNNIVPTWIDCNMIFGHFDEESGKWIGEIGKVCF